MSDQNVRESNGSQRTSVVRLRSNEYVHILDNSTCLTRLLCGPLTYTLQDSVTLLHREPQPYIVVPPNHFCIVENPVTRDVATGSVALHKATGIPMQRFNAKEVRLTQPPFPLYPGEVMSDETQALPLLTEGDAYVIGVLADYYDGKNEIQRTAGDCYVFRGPGFYIPHVCEHVERKLPPVVVKDGMGFEVMAKVDHTDTSGTFRKAGEVWQLTKPGAYYCDRRTLMDQESCKIRGEVPSSEVAIHLVALHHFHDTVFNKDRVPGEEWLVTREQGVRLYIRSPHEAVVGHINVTQVRSNQYCVVINPVVDGCPCPGAKELRRGPCRFFLNPGEILEDGEVKDVILLGSDEALLVEAQRTFTDDSGTEREIASRWMVRGPVSYVPPVEVEIIERRGTIALSAGEGVYVRNTETGKVTAVCGRAILLDEKQELWEKYVSPEVERLLQAPRLSCWNHDDATLSDASVASVRSGGTTNAQQRKPYSVVVCNVPHNSLVQLYDYKEKRSRVVEGPTRVFLDANEEFTVISLSAGRPKRPNCIKSLCLFLGPDYMADVIEVETLDHTRLRLNLAYNWEFGTSPEINRDIAFTVPDFVGETCKMLASRIRAAVATEPFESIHRNSTALIRQAIFCDWGNGTMMNGDALCFPVSGLCITNVDVHSIEPVDLKTRDALTKSVQLAVEIITKSQENEAAHNAASLEQTAHGALEYQIMSDRIAIEEHRSKLMGVTASNAGIEAVGSSKAQAQAEADALKVETETEVEVTKTRCETLEVSTAAELEIQKQRNDLDVAYRKAINDLAVHKLRQANAIEVARLTRVMKAIGKDTLVAIARAGPEVQAKLLAGLGLQGFLITDGTSPLNLMNVTNGMFSAPSAKAIARP